MFVFLAAVYNVGYLSPRPRRGTQVFICTVAVAEPALGADQLEALARFRFAQYLAAGFVDEDVA